MSTVRQLFAIVLAFVWASVGVCDDEDWFKADSTKKLSKIIDEFRENYELVQSERRAFVCEGTRLRNTRGRMQISDIRFIRCIDKDLKFRANSVCVSGAMKERWSQKLLYRGKLHQRLGPFTTDNRGVIDDEDEIEKALTTTRLFSPIDNAISPADCLVGQPPRVNAERKLTVGELVSGEFGENGTIVQKILRSGGIRSVQDEYTWSRVEGTDTFFPVRYDYFYINDEGARQRSLVKTQWKKIDGLIVPSSMQLVDFSKVDSLDVSLSISYLFGSEIGKSPVIEPKMSDWREPIRVMFDKEWLRRGGAIPVIRRVEN
jgi:hypothetical protein